MKIEFIDPVCVPDVFATELVSVEDLGGVFRFTFAARQNGELVVVARVALLSSAVPKGRLLTAAAAGIIGNGELINAAISGHGQEAPHH